MKVYLFFFIAVALYSVNARVAQTQESTDELFDLSLEEFLDVEIVSISKIKEKASIAPGTVYVITGEEIKLYGIRNLQEALSYVPSVYLYDPHSWVWGGQRGFISNFSQTLLLVNGREFNNIIAGEGFISRQFSTYNIERIEVVPSPMSALYGANALAGVINIITKDGNPDFNGVEVSMEVGSYSTLSEGILFGAPIGDLSLKGSVRRYNSDEEDYLDFVRDSERYSKGWVNAQDANPFITQYENPSTSTALNLQLDYKSFYLGGNYYRNEQSHGLEKLRWNYTDGQDERDFSLLYGGYDGRINDSMRLKLEYQHYRSYLWGVYHAGLWPGSKLQTPDGAEIYQFPDEVITSSGDVLHGLDEITAYYPSFYDYLTDQNVLDPATMTAADIETYFNHIYTNKESRGNTRDRFDLQWTWDLSDRISLNTGYMFDHIDCAGLAVMDGWIGTGALFSTSLDYSKRDSVYRSDKHGVFSQINLELLEEQLYLSGGARYDEQNHYGSTVNPRAGLVWRPVKSDVFKFIYGEAFREPNVFELASNPQLEPSKLRSYELSYSHSFGDIAQTHLTVYHNAVDDYLDTVGSIIGSGVETIDEQTVQGLEGRLDLRYGPILTFINGAYIFNAEQKIEVPSTGELETFDLLNLPEAKANWGISYLFNPHYSLSLLSSYIWPYDALSGNPSISEPFEIPAYFTMKMTFNASGFKMNYVTWDWFITVNNLLDRKNYHPNIRRSGPHMFLQDGRGIYAGITARF